MVETLVAVFILTFAIAAPLTAVFRTIKTSETSVNQIQAYYLAQEGVEYIRYVRDTNVVEGAGWLRYLDRTLFGDSCGIILPTRVVDAVQDFRRCNNPCRISKRPANKMLGTASGDDTPFYRTITVTETIVGQEADIAVVVEWPTERGTSTYTLRETMFNWSEN